MRIAQFTFNGYENYGNILQRYALQQILKRYADVVEVLGHHLVNDGEKFSAFNWEFEKNIIDNMCMRPEYRREFGFRLIRQARLKLFVDHRIRTRFDFDYLEDLVDEYDFFVVGSDQVWNPYICGEQSFIAFDPFLSFAPKHKCIAYAVSIALPEIPAHFKEYFRQGISEIAHVSVREKNSVRLINELLNQQGGCGYSIGIRPDDAVNRV